MFVNVMQPERYLHSSAANSADAEVDSGKLDSYAFHNSAIDSAALKKSVRMAKARDWNVSIVHLQ